MKLTVVIPTFNRASALRRCVESLAGQGDRFDVIAVVDRGPDGTAARLGELNLPFRLQCINLDENRGQSAARNAGARAATGEILLFLDDDMTASPGLVNAHLKNRQVNQVVFGQTSQMNAPYYRRLAENPTPLWPLDAWVGPNCSIGRDLFLNSGGYNESQFARCGEDIDLGFRLWREGIRFTYAPAAIAVHHDQRTRRAKRLAEFSHGRAAFRLGCNYPAYRRHLPLARLVRSPWRRLVPGAWLAGIRHECGAWNAFKSFAGQRLPVLLYHHVGSPSSETTRDSLTVTPANFASQMQWLRKNGYSAITPSQWLAWLDHAEPLPPKPVLLTFDDAFAELEEQAFPLLRDLGMRGAIFTIAGLTDTDNLWEGKRVMSSASLAHWHREGIETGHHTHTHPDLRTLTGTELTSEITGPGACFAYPFGEYNPAVREAVATSFPLAFTCDEGLNDLWTDPHLLKRTNIEPGDTLLDFKLRVWLGWSPLHALRTRLRPRSRARWLLRKLGLRR